MTAQFESLRTALHGLITIYPFWQTLKTEQAKRRPCMLSARPKNLPWPGHSHIDFLTFLSIGLRLHKDRLENEAVKEYVVI